MASQIVDQYGSVFSPAQRARIASQLLGKYRTSGALSPKPALYTSRFLDLSDISQRLGVNPEEEAELEKEAADTMLAGGKIHFYKRKPSHSRSRQSRGSKGYRGHKGYRGSLRSRKSRRTSS